MSNSYKILNCFGANKWMADQAILSSGFAGFTSKIEYYGFVYQTIASEYFNEEKDRYATGATQVSLTNEGLAKIKNSVLINELGLPGTTTKIEVCTDEVAKPQGTILDNNGAIIGWVTPGSITKVESSATTGDTEGEVTFTMTGDDYKGKTIKFDFYVVMKDNCTVISIKPGDFGGYFYVEADTLYRNQDGKDMAATLTFPKVKVQSGFTISMAPNGDPSTFDFVMDAFPAYTKFDTTKQVVCDIAIVGGGSVEAVTASHTTPHDNATITVPGDDGDDNP
jgi:hypothetical protein